MPLPPDGTAVHVTVVPVVAEAGETLQVPVGAVGAAATVTVSQALQLLLVFDSLITVAPAPFMLPHQRTLYVPAEANVYESETLPVADAASVSVDGVAVAYAISTSDAFAISSWLGKLVAVALPIFSIAFVPVKV